MENVDDSGMLSIAVRHTHGGALLYFHIPEDQRETFVQGIRSGVVELRAGTQLEVPVLPEFVADPEARKILQDGDVHLHLKIPVVKICT